MLDLQYFLLTKFNLTQHLFGPMIFGIKVFLAKHSLDQLFLVPNVWTQYSLDQKYSLTNKSFWTTFFWANTFKKI